MSLESPTKKHNQFDTSELDWAQSVVKVDWVTLNQDHNRMSTKAFFLTFVNKSSQEYITGPTEPGPALPLFGNFTMEFTENCLPKNSIFSIGTTGFGNPTTTLKTQSTSF